MTKKEFQKLDASIESFIFLKEASEKYWEKVSLEFCSGYQIQEGSRWKKGLTAEELLDFQHTLGFEFPLVLKNYYSVMNGLDNPGIYNNGKDAIEYGPTFYTYPEDIAQIKAMIQSVWNAYSITPETGKTIPDIFPYYIHRFLILNQDMPVLSMHGDDVLYWSENLCKGIAVDVFPPLHSKSKVELDPSDFWYQKINP